MKKFIFDSNGSFTLEATIVFPVFLALMLLLINFINVVMVYVAVDHAVSETAKQLATRAYPLKYLKATPATNPFQKGFSGVISNFGTLNGQSGQQISSVIASDAVTLIGNKIMGEASEAAVNSVMRTVAGEKIKELYPLYGIAERGLTITKVKMYNPNNNAGSGSSVNGIPLNNKDIAIAVEYRVKMPVPIFPLKEITLSNTAVERAWVED